MSVIGSIQKIRKAIDNEGINSEYHAFILSKHRKEWPTLWKAIDELLKEGEVNGKEEKEDKTL